MPVAVSESNYYAILELEKGATEDNIRVAYKKLVSWHFTLSGGFLEIDLRFARRSNGILTATKNIRMRLRKSSWR